MREGEGEIKGGVREKRWRKGGGGREGEGVVREE